jgi:phosphoketolase
MQDSPAATTLDAEALRNIDAYWRAANYLSVGQIFLCANPLLREPLAVAHVKRMLLGHWGTTPGQNFIYTHLNRVIKKFDLDMIYLSGPGHGGPAVVSGTYLEGTYSEIYAEISEDTAGLERLFKQFSFPGGIPSHASAEVPGSIHEGGELGYSLSHAFGAVFDNPSLITACVIGDGEAETGPLATAWHSNKFLNPQTDGAVLPILHLNGYKIANPTVLARIPPRPWTSRACSAPATHVCSRHSCVTSPRATPSSATSACSGPTRRYRTAWGPSSRPPIGSGRHPRCRTTIFSRVMAASWKCSVNINARGGSRAIC